MPDTQSPHPRRTFLELYCEQNQIEASEYERHVLRRSLYPHARLLAPILRLLWLQHFAADVDLVRSAASVRRVRDLMPETDAHAYHPANVGALRQFFRLRASTTRLHRLVRATLHAGDAAPNA
ncbi:MAG: hypothetical protein MUE42_07500 [Opitutaceae bacterium]|nr:hypothetical protein [Opitutaceae bacterium]